MNVLLFLMALAVPADVPGGLGRPVDPAVEEDLRPEPLSPHRLPPEVHLDRTGLPELIVGSSFNGAVVGTLVTQALFPGEESARAASGTVLGVGAGILVPILAAGGRSIVPAQAAFYNFGQRWGLVNGLLVPVMWGAQEGWHYAISVTTLVATGALTTVAAWPHLEPTPGQVSALGTFHGFTTIAASLITLLFDLVPDSGSAFAAPILLLSNASVGAAWVLRDDFDIDRRRVIWTDIGGYTGLAVGLASGLLVVRYGGSGGQPHREQVLAATMLGGMTGGLVLGYGLSTGLDAFRRSAPREGTDVTLEVPGLRPLVTGVAGGQSRAATGWILDLVRGRW